jgi:hyperosmotically inducible protein
MAGKGEYMSSHRNRTLGAALALGMGLLVAPPQAAAADLDGDIRERIQEKIKDAKLDRQAQVDVAVEDGRVRLSGVATTLHASREIERRALQVTDGVANEIRVMPEEPRTAYEIREDVRKTILRYVYYGIFDSVELAVSDAGVVRLEGSVLDSRRQRDIERRVAKVAGVRAIENGIRVQSVSAFDDRLRYQLARAIYGDPRFVHYGARANPPVHIIVERGRVTLTGYVASPVEQAMLGHIARGVLSFGVENRVEVDGARPEEPGSRTRS